VQVAALPRGAQVEIEVIAHYWIVVPLAFENRDWLCRRVVVGLVALLLKTTAAGRADGRGIAPASAGAGKGVWPPVASSTLPSARRWPLPRPIRNAAKKPAGGHAQKLTPRAFAPPKKRRNQALADLRETFKALSADALKQSAPQFLQLANETLGKFQETAKGDLATRQQALPLWCSR